MCVKLSLSLQKLFLFVWCQPNVKSMAWAVEKHYVCAVRHRTQSNFCANEWAPCCSPVSSSYNTSMGYIKFWATLQHKRKVRKYVFCTGWIGLLIQGSSTTFVEGPESFLGDTVGAVVSIKKKWGLLSILLFYVCTFIKWKFLLAYVSVNTLLKTMVNP